VIGLIMPCHRPSQKPAGSGPVSTISFGPAAHAESVNKAMATPSTRYLREVRIDSWFSCRWDTSPGCIRSGPWRPRSVFPLLELGSAVR
jgi:hypothetical protein